MIGFIHLHMKNKGDNSNSSWMDTGALIIATFKSILIPILAIVFGLILAILLFTIMFS